MFFTVLTIQFSSNCQMDIGNQLMLKCLWQKHVEKKNQRENCIMWLHLYSKLLLFKVVAYVFSWFTKFHGFMILTGTTKIGIQQIKLSIHTSEKNYENFIYCILRIYKFVNCIFYHFIIVILYTILIIVYYNKIYTSCMPWMKIWYTSVCFFLLTVW